jgi:hypothetical protein
VADEISDLLRPSLGEEHDVVEIRAPLSPAMILIVTFFAGLVSGLILTAWNDVRCGLQRRVKWVAMAGAALLVLWGGSLHWMMNSPMEEARQATRDALWAHVNTAPGAEERSDEGDSDAIAEIFRRDVADRDAAKDRALDARQSHRMVWRGVGVLGVYLLSLPQRRRVRIANARGVECASQKVPILVSIAIGLLTHAALAFAIAMAVL